MKSFSVECSRFLGGDRPDAPARVRLLAGAGVGACFAIFAPVFLAMWAFEGPEVITQKGVVIRVDWLVLLYPLGAVVTGALLMLLAPFGRNRAGKALLGVVAFVPWIGAIALCVDRGYVDWQRLHTLLTGVSALLFGAPIGWMAHPLTAKRPGQASRTSAI